MTVITSAPARNHLALAALIVGGIAIGGSPIFVKFSEVGPIATAFWRVGLAFLPFFILSQVGSKAPADAAPAGFRDRALLVLPGIFLAIDLVAWHLALDMTSVANATLLSNLAPIFVTLGSWILFRTAVSRIFITGLMTALVGVIVLKGGPLSLADGHLAGDATSILASMFYAGYILALGQLRAKFSTSRIMIWSTFSAAVCVLPAALLLESNVLPVTLFGWAMVVGLAMISHASGQAMIVYALAYLPPALSSLTLLLQPVVAAVLAWALLNEPVGVMQAIGGAIVLLGILIARRG